MFSGRVHSGSKAGRAALFRQPGSADFINSQIKLPILFRPFPNHYDSGKMGPDTEINLNPDMMVEFNLSVLEKRMGSQELMDEMYECLVKVVSEDDIGGMYPWPHYRPQTFHIQCENRNAMEILLTRGIVYEGKKVDLYEPGYGAIRAVIHDAPFTKSSNAVMLDWLKTYGEVTGFKHQRFTHRKTGKRTEWKSGARIAFIKLNDLNRTLPPSVVLEFSNNVKKRITIFHYGQAQKHCRFCKENVPRDHQCDRAPVKTCFNCKLPGHFISECPVGKECDRCNQTGHLAKNCPMSHQEYLNQHFPHLNADEAPSRTPSKSDTRAGQNMTKSDSPVLFSTPLAGNVRVVTTKVLVHEKPVTTTDETAPEKDEWQKDRTGKRREYNARRKSQTSQDDTDIEVIQKDIPVKPAEERKRKREKSAGKNWNLKRFFGLEKEVTLDNTELLEDNSKPEEPNKEIENGEEEDVSEEEEATPVMETDGDKSEEEKLGDVTQDSDAESTTANGDSSKGNSEDQDDENEDKQKSDPIPDTVETEEGGESDENISLSVIQKENEIKHHFSLHTIGASNMEGLVMKGDEQLEITHHNHFEGGMKINRSHDMLDEIHEGEKLNLPIIAINIGACDMSEIGHNDLGRMEDRYVKMLGKVREECPKAQIIISGLIPRNGDKYDKVNHDTLLFNERLRNLCIPEKGFVFCDNYNWVMNEFNQVRSELYKENSSIHLNILGQESLSNSIFRMVKYLYFKSIVGDLPESLGFTPEEEASMYRIQ